MDLYREEVMDHYENPRNRGKLLGENILVGEHNIASCGDAVQFYLRVVDERIVEVKWQGSGCAIMCASASKLSVWLVGKSTKVLQELSEEEIAEKGVGFVVNAGRSKCLMLSVKVIKKVVTPAPKM